MNWRRYCAGLVLVVAALAASGCACHRACRTSCCAPAAAPSPCCGDAAAPGAPVPVQAFSAPYAGH